MLESVEIGLVGLFALLLVKETGVPVPVPGDLLVLGAGVASAHGDVNPAVALPAILVAGYVGGIVQFALLRGGLRGPLLAFLGRFGLRQDRVEGQVERLRRRGMSGVAISRATPGVRVIAIAASALAAIPFTSFAAGLVLGNTAFVGFHFLLGFFLGEPALGLVASYGTALAIGGVAAAAFGGLAWWALRRNAASAGDPRSTGQPFRGADTFTDWADATCPVCLTLGFVGIRQGET